MIYFDVTRLLEWKGRYTGMERVAYELALNMVKLNDVGEQTRLVYYIKGRGFIDVTNRVVWREGQLYATFSRKDSIKSLLKSKPTKAVGLYVKRKFEKFILPSGLSKIEPSHKDTLFISDGLWDRHDYINEIIKLGSGKVSIAHLIHDMVPIVAPHVCHGFVTEAINTYFNAITPYIDVLISISKNTERDYFEIFGKQSKPNIKKAIVRHGDDFCDLRHQRPKTLPKEIKDFILCVGTIEIRKNHILLYQAYKLARERQIDLPSLVIAGREGWLAEQTIKLMKNDPEVKDKFIFTGAIEDRELVWLYKNCNFTTLASVYEGWGLQVSESLYYGKVCAASSAGPIPEVGGDLNLYFSPYSPESCLDTIIKLTDANILAKREKKIVMEYKPSKWIDAARTIKSIL